MLVYSKQLINSDDIMMIHKVELIAPENVILKQNEPVKNKKQNTIKC
jgi:hypothetical protein